MDDYTSWPSEGLLWRHIGLVIHIRFFKQLLFGVLPAVGTLAPLTAGDLLSEQYDFFYPYYISLEDIDSIAFILHRFGVLPAVGKLAPLTACDFLSEQYDFFYTYYISVTGIDSIVFVLHRRASLPTAPSNPKRSCLEHLSWMTTLASGQRSCSGGTLG